MSTKKTIISGEKAIVKGKSLSQARVTKTSIEVEGYIFPLSQDRNGLYTLLCPDDEEINTGYTINFMRYEAIDFYHSHLKQ